MGLCLNHAIIYFDAWVGPGQVPKSSADIIDVHRARAGTFPRNHKKGRPLLSLITFLANKPGMLIWLIVVLIASKSILLSPVLWTPVHVFEFLDDASNGCFGRCSIWRWKHHS